MDDLIAVAKIQASAAAAHADDLVWKLAQDSLAGYKTYLIDFPNGRHAEAARQYERDYSDDDGDGVPNKDDKCPTSYGVATYYGCPLSDLHMPEMIFVPGGRFIMGCKDSIGGYKCLDWAKPSHEVTVQDFYISKYVVSEAEWNQVMDSRLAGLNIKMPRSPSLTEVSWDEVQEFIRKLNAQTGKKYRLPTEAEWEYAARGGNKSKDGQYGMTIVIKNAKTSVSSNIIYPTQTRTTNELGLYNGESEWVEDDWHDSYTGAPTDGSAWLESNRGKHRVIRLATSRYFQEPMSRVYHLGFRLVH